MTHVITYTPSASGIHHSIGHVHSKAFHVKDFTEAFLSYAILGKGKGVLRVKCSLNEEAPDFTDLPSKDNEWYFLKGAYNYIIKDSGITGAEFSLNNQCDSLFFLVRGIAWVCIETNCDDGCLLSLSLVLKNT